MTVQVYRYDDASAPTLTGQAGSLVGLLDACLVNGYGTKDPAGWDIAYTATNKRAYRAATGNRHYLRVDNASNGSRVRGFQSMSDVDTGSDPFPNNTQINNGGYWYSSNSTNDNARAWMIVANEKTFWLYICTSSTSTSTVFQSQNPGHVLYFWGEIEKVLSSDSKNTAIICGTSDSPNDHQCGSTSAYTGNIGGHFICESSTGTKSLNINKVTSSNLGNASGNGLGRNVNSIYPDAITGGISLGKVFVTENVSGSYPVRAMWPGLHDALHTYATLPAGGDTFSGRGNLTGKTFIILNTYGSSVDCKAVLETSDTW
jgi:hypothetical protein